MYQVTINDHSSLGGPMGTEHTPTISQKHFHLKEDAYSYAYKQAKKHIPHDIITEEAFNKLSYSKKNSYLGDLGPIGIDIIKVTVH